MSKQLVLMDHDGGVDDYLATMLLLTMDRIELFGVIVTPADCYVKPAVSATRKIIDLMGFSHIPVAESTVRGINSFPTPIAAIRLSLTISRFSIKAKPLLHLWLSKQVKIL